MNSSRSNIVALGAVLYVLCPGQVALTQDAKAQLAQMLATAREAMARNQEALRKYSWTEHTDIVVKGDVKSKSDDLCRYGADGKVSKTPIGTPATKKKAGGLRGKVAENKKDELKDYIERSLTLIHRYVPPSPETMKVVFDAGNVGLGDAVPGQFALRFNNYWQAGDSLTFSFDTTTRRLRQMSIDSYLSDPKEDVVTLAVAFDTLPDGTNHVSTATLNADQKKLQVKIRNENYQKLAQ